MTLAECGTVPDSGPADCDPRPSLWHTGSWRDCFVTVVVSFDVLKVNYQHCRKKENLPKVIKQSTAACVVDIVKILTAPRKLLTTNLHHLDPGGEWVPT